AEHGAMVQPADFFFEEVDGIGLLIVTGVQTCALGIWGLRRGWEDGHRGMEAKHGAMVHPAEQRSEYVHRGGLGRDGEWSTGCSRSEERRVGKEGRTRGRGDEPEERVGPAGSSTDWRRG